MKRAGYLLFMIAVILLLSGCFERQIADPTTEHKPSTSTPAAPSLSVPEDECLRGHLFENLSNTCTRCGENYFNATLEFQLTEAKDAYFVSSVGTCDRSLVEIPATHKGLPVTGIGAQAFSAIYHDSCANITGIILPSSIHTIGENAFDNCVNLKSINIPEGVTEIEAGAFFGCTRLKNVRLPQSLTTIGNSAFSDCKALTEMEIPENVTTIEGGAFAFCTNLVRLELHDGITFLGDTLVMFCESLESIYISSAITEIGQDFAACCSALKTVEFGGEITSIGIGAFQSCTNLEMIDLGSKLEAIPDYAFDGCTKLRTVIMPDNITQIGKCAFRNCASLQNIPISDELISLGEEAFVACSALYNVYEGFGYVGSTTNPYLILASRVDKTQKNAVVHDDAVFAHAYAFANSDIESIYLGKSMEYVNVYTFEKMYALRQIRVSPENKKFHDAGNCLIETASKTLVKGCVSSVIPDDGSVTKIGILAFAYQDNLTQMVIPNTVEVIDANAFCFCKDLKWLVIGSGVKRIEHDVFIEANESVLIFYIGSAEDWKNMEIFGNNYGSGLGGNSILLNAQRYYYSEEKPTEDGLYWHYVDGVPTPWETEDE